MPLYNEEKRFDQLVSGIRRWKPSTHTEIILVDDGSKDRTRRFMADSAGALLDENQKIVRSVLLPSNLGKGGAIKAGVQEATGDFIGFLDADLAIGFEDVATAVDLLSNGGYEVVISDRRHPDSVAVRAPGLKRWVSSLAFNVVVRSLGMSQLGEHKLGDTQCPFKFFRRDAAVKLFPMLSSQGFAFDVELLYLANRFGYRSTVIPVSWEHSDNSSVNPVVNGLAMLKELLVIKRKWGISPWKKVNSVAP